MSFAAMMLVALLIDVLCGWPSWLFSRVGHPVTWLGRLVDGLERLLNRGSFRGRLAKGAVCVLVCLLVTGALAVGAQALLPSGLAGVLLGGVLAWPLVALRSLQDHVTDVARPMEQGDTEAARQAVAMIVGRDPDQLDAAGIARAATESLAENASDGIVAPVFWGVVAGLPGIALYKAINTLDSMIGHRSERYEAFGKLAARLDDLVNLVPARLTGLLFALAQPARAGDAWQVMRRDAPQHRSPNAGWPEGAMAGALGVRLSGPRRYADRVAHEPWINATAADPGPKDLQRALHVYRRAMVLMGIALLGLALI